MPISLDTEHKLIGDIYDAALEPKLWPQVLSEIAEHWQCNYINLVAGDQLNPNTVIVHAHGTTEEQIRWYMENKLDVLDKQSAMEWLKRGLPIGTAAANHQLFGSIENYKQAAGRFYTDCLQKMGVLYQIGSILELTDFRYSIIGLNRGEQQPFSDDEVAIASRLMPHIRRAIQIHRQIIHVREQTKILYRMLDNMVAGVLLLDVNGRVCYANPSAEILLSQSGTLSASARYGLKAADDAQWAELNKLVQGAIKTGTRERHYLGTHEERKSGGVIGLTNQHGEKPLMLTITPLSEMSGYEQLASDGIAAGIFLTDPNAQRIVAKKILQQNYLLNDRECDVCEAFLNCATLEGVAEALGLTASTVRSYMRDIYEKTQHRSQAELMKLLMGLTIEFEHIR